ncbi:hypothetical protein NKJ46_28930 [Mesorhizobium sp. M0166]|uniref:hypothetical protein n=1 Tax=unclassified Mesorhizobium TaxID=325217 RepID=UPI00333C41C9
MKQQNSFVTPLSAGRGSPVTRIYLESVRTPPDHNRAPMREALAFEVERPVLSNIASCSLLDIFDAGFEHSTDFHP